MKIDELFGKLKKGFAPHSLELDDWGCLRYIIMDDERIGVVSVHHNLQTKLPKIYYNEDKMRKSAYAKDIGKQMFTLIKNHIQKEHERKTTETEKKLKIKNFQTACEERLEQLRNDGRIDYDVLKKSKSTESVYVYNGKKRILRISTHQSYLKDCIEKSIIIKPDKVGEIDIFIGDECKAQ
ncbi:MAG: hypothetical protein LBQ05_01800 [Christensenellaceae bacterium]|nr:hypothetical protein [Christensenellaceae bacterium]